MYHNSKSGKKKKTSHNPGSHDTTHPIANKDTMHKYSGEVTRKSKYKIK